MLKSSLQRFLFCFSKLTSLALPTRYFCSSPSSYHHAASAQNRPLSGISHYLLHLKTNKHKQQNLPFLQGKDQTLTMKIPLSSMAHLTVSMSARAYTQRHTSYFPQTTISSQNRNHILHMIAASDTQNTKVKCILFVKI